MWSRTSSSLDMNTRKCYHWHNCWGCVKRDRKFRANESDQVQIEPQHKQWSSVTLAEWVMILSQSQSSTAIDVYFSCTPSDGLFRAYSSRVSWGRTLHTKWETRTPYRFVLDDIQLSYPRCLLISGPTRRCQPRIITRVISIGRLIDWEP